MTVLDENDLREILFSSNRHSDLEEKLRDLLDASFARGEPVYLEGIGTIAREPDGRIRVDACIRPRVFLAYVVEDLPRVQAIFRFLRSHGFDPWMDVEKLLPGQNWPRAIERAIQSADFFVPCFSEVSTGKRGFFQAELRYAIDCALQQPLEEVYLVPIRLDDCRLPAAIQQRTQYVDLFPDFETGLRRLLQSLRVKQFPQRKKR